MTQINDRIREIRNILKLSQREFSRRIQISQSLYCDLENGKISLKPRYLTLICNEFNVNLEFLKTGKGKMFNSEQPPDTRLEYLVDLFKQFNPDLQDVVLDHLRNLLKVQKDKKK